MLVTNLTDNDYWFGPLHLPAGIGQTLTVDDTSSTSLYLTDDVVADALNNLYAASKISVSGEAEPFPRPTGIPQLLHGDGSPDGRIFAPQGSLYLRRDNTGPSSTLYVKTSGVTLSTDWFRIATDVGAAPTGTIHAFGGTTAPSSEWLLCDGAAVSRVIYAELFGVVGIAYGVGDGSTTFNVPDLRGRVAAGFAASGGHSDVSTLGLNEGSAPSVRRPRHPHSNALTLPNHVHSFSDPGHGHVFDISNGGTNFSLGHNAPRTPTTTSDSPPGGTTGPVYNSTTGISVGNPTSNPAINGTIGAAGTASDAPAYLVVNYIIKT
jgi:microcystin-dependent protein